MELECRAELALGKRKQQMMTCVFDFRNCSPKNIKQSSWKYYQFTSFAGVNKLTAMYVDKLKEWNMSILLW